MELCSGKKMATKKNGERKEFANEIEARKKPAAMELCSGKKWR
jgi:hypothetical protein